MTQNLDYFKKIEDLILKNFKISLSEIPLPPRSELFLIPSDGLLMGSNEALKRQYLAEGDIYGFFDSAPEGYFLIGFWGHGINSYAFYYIRADSKCKIFFRLPYGGVYMDNTKEADSIGKFLPAFFDFERNLNKVKSFYAMESMGNGRYKVTLENTEIEYGTIYFFNREKRSFSKFLDAIHSREGFKDSKIGLIPKEWQIKTFSEIVDIIGGGTPKTTNSDFWNGDIPWLSVVDFNNNFRTVFETEKSITELGLKNSSTKILKKGEIIISARGTVGATAQLGKEMAFNQSCYGLRAKDGFNNDFIYYLLNYKLNQLKQTTHGSTFDTITTKTFDLLEVAVPTLHEQKSIANVLSVIDDKIELNQEMNRALESIGQAIFRHWFVHYEFPDENGQPYKSSGGKMVNSDLGEIPAGWQIKPLDQVANYLNGLALQKYPPENEDYLPVIKIRELKQGITQQTDKASKKIPDDYIIKDGDVIFSWSGSLEVVIWGEGDGALNQHLFKVDSENYPKWFYYYQTLRFLPFFRQIAADKATTMGHIKRSHLSESLVAIPSANILKQGNNVLNPIIEHIIINKINSRNLTSIRDSLLPILMSGKVRVKWLWRSNIES